MIKRTAALRLSAEIAFFYSFLCLFDIFRPWVLPMAVFTAAAMIVGYAAAGIKNPALRGLLSLIPSLAFLLGPFKLAIAAPLAVAVYFTVSMTLGRFTMPLCEYRSTLRTMLVLGLIVFAANVANSMLFTDRALSVPSLVFAGVFVILGVISMRLMQMGAPMDLKWQLWNLGTVIALPAAAFAGAIVLFVVLRSSAVALNVIFYPVGRFFIWVFYKLFSHENLPVEESELADYVMKKAHSFSMELPVGSDTAVERPEESAFTNLMLERATTIGAYVILALLVILAAWLVILLAKRGREEEPEELYYEDTVTDNTRKRRSKRRMLPIGNAAQIRRIYRVWLEYVRAKGLEVAPSDTSRDVLESAEASPDAVRLREKYIAARYGDPRSVTGADVDEAQALLDALTGG